MDGISGSFVPQPIYHITDLFFSFFLVTLALFRFRIRLRTKCHFDPGRQRVSRTHTHAHVPEFSSIICASRCRIQHNNLWTLFPVNKFDWNWLEQVCGRMWSVTESFRSLFECEKDVYSIEDLGPIRVDLLLQRNWIAVAIGRVENSSDSADIDHANLGTFAGEWVPSKWVQIGKKLFPILNINCNRRHGFSRARLNFSPDNYLLLGNFHRLTSTLAEFILWTIRTAGIAFA